MVPIAGAARESRCRLRAPARVAAVSVPTASAGAAPRGGVAPAAAHTYVVRSGDTLYAISKRFDTDVETLLEINNLKPRSVLQPGMKIRLP
jgi:LysM repeat protein